MITVVPDHLIKIDATILPHIAEQDSAGDFLVVLGLALLCVVNLYILYGSPYITKWL